MPVVLAMILSIPAAAMASGPPSFSLPEQASEVAPGVFFLGNAVKDGVVLEGYAYVHPATAGDQGRRANAKPPGTPGGGNKGDGGGNASNCYSYIANGAKWNSLEGYVANLSFVPSGVDLSGINAAFGSWETAAGTNIVNNGSSTTNTLVADTNSTDGQNEIYFASINEANVLGYTIVWSTRGFGRKVPGQVVEADMVIDTDSEWSWYTGAAAGIGSGQIDFWSVFTHEAGHWVGMGHTSTDSVCLDQTMYPSIAKGDSSKRDLGVGDVAGASKLYG